MTKEQIQAAMAKKAPSMKAVELRYNAQLQRWFKSSQKEILKQIQPMLQEMTRTDSLSDIIDSAFAELFMALANMYAGSGLMTIMNTAAAGVFGVNDRKYSSPVYSKLAINAVPMELTADLRKNWIMANTGLITKVSTNELAAIRALMLDNAFSGRRAKSLLEQLNSIFKGSRNNISVIARDQIGKLGGQLDRLKQTNAGIEGYYWRSSRDERVRSAHAHREGEYFAWDRPPPDGHPGQPIQCRCDAEPALDRLYGDRSLGRDNAKLNSEAVSRSIAAQRKSK